MSRCPVRSLCAQEVLFRRSVGLLEVSNEFLLRDWMGCSGSFKYMTGTIRATQLGPLLMSTGLDHI